MVDISTSLCGIKLDNPVMGASGTFGYGEEFAELYDTNKLGSFSFKGITEEPRFGNATPRIAECPAGMINSVGLQNPGVKVLVNEILPEMKKIFHKPVMANINGFSVGEYERVAASLEGQDNIGWLEVNVSCPNVHGGGMSFGTSAKAAAEVTAAVRKQSTKPIIIKLSPNVTDITEIAKACEAAGADGISLINTMLGMRINLKSRRPVIANKSGGYSGPGIFPVAVSMIYRVYESVNIPIVGMGGVTSADDVIEMMMAGARCVQVGAANLTDPYICPKIIDDLPKAMEKYNIEKLADIIGAAH